MKLLSKVCNISSIADYILNDKSYKGLNPYQKENIIIQVFHSRNWGKLQKVDRIVLLQELENIEALKLKRDSYHFVQLKSNYKWESLLMDMGHCSSNKSILVRKNYIEEGIKQHIRNGKVVKVVCSFLNTYLLDSLYHEQYHIMTNFYIRERPSSAEYKELMEYLIWVLGADFCDKQVKKEDKRYYIYRMIPDEYYAFKYAQSKVMHTFSILNSYYGMDENYTEYLRYMSESERYTIETYQEHFRNCDDITYDEIYRKLLDEYLSKAFLIKYEKEEIKRSLALLPSIFDKKNNIITK